MIRVVGIRDAQDAGEVARILRESFPDDDLDGLLDEIEGAQALDDALDALHTWAEKERVLVDSMKGAVT